MSISSVEVKMLGDKEIKLPKHLDTEENRKLIPHMRKYSVKVHIKKASKEIVNGLRRTLMEEIEIKGLEVDKDNIDTDDTNIMWNSIKVAIESIRLDQNVPANIRFHLEYTNNTTYPQMVRASHLKSDHKFESPPFNESFRIMTVRPGHFLRIKNIKVISVQARRRKDNVESDEVYPWPRSYGLYTAVTNCGMDCPNIEKYERGVGQSSLTTEPTEYIITLGTNGNVDIKTLLKAACASISARSREIYKELVTVTNDNHISNIVDISTYNDEMHFRIKNETYTIAALISYFIFKKHPDISLANYSVPHPTKTEFIYRIVSQDPKKTMLEALDNITQMFQNLESQFEAKNF